MIVRQNRPEDPSLQVPVSIDDPRNALIPFKTRKLCPALILIGDYFSALKFLPLLMVPVWICSGEMSMCYIDSIACLDDLSIFTQRVCWHRLHSDQSIYPASNDADQPR